LIVLVITIIVIIILATSVIVTIVQNNPIGKADEAVFKSDFKVLQEELNMYITNKVLEVNGDINKFNVKNFNVNEKSINPTLNEVLINLEKSRIKDKVEIKEGKLVFIGTDKKEKEWFDEVSNENKEPSIPGNMGDGTDDKTKSTWDHPFVPAGFYYVGGTPKTGYVISDNSADAGKGTSHNNVLTGNQFVWVPVGGNATGGNGVTYGKITEKPLNWSDEIYGMTFENYMLNFKVSEGSVPNSVKSMGITTHEEQITKYGGFYVARYEAGLDKNYNKYNDEYEIIKSQKGSIRNASNIDEAKTYAENMIKTGSVRTGLITGAQWDTLLKWISLTPMPGTSEYYNICDVSKWGNLHDRQGPADVPYDWSAEKITGYSDKWMVNNIYDLSGNFDEWTNEYLLCEGALVGVNKGGNMYDYGKNGWPMLSPIGAGQYVAGRYTTLRVVLYII
ncbi:MAG: hypothetical protein RSB67_03700, partial [Clostridia bacterium]